MVYRSFIGHRAYFALTASLFFCSAVPALAQSEAPGLRLYGYFQNEFQHEFRQKENQSTNSFFLQQLNFFVQRKLTGKWSTFVNFELLNTYSSQRRTGAFNLEEAWAKYRFSKELTLKFGLQIPIFNHLNQIKNRTPLLPYVIRPLVYETSFAEILTIDEFLPTEAFLQAYGTTRIGRAKIDHAVYLGNSPNIARWEDNARSGEDSTATFLVGGRLGLRLEEFELGFSASHDQVNFFKEAENFSFRFDNRLVQYPEDRFKQMHRYRFGGDLFYAWGPFSLAAEFISLVYDDGRPELSFDKQFYYGTLEYRPTEAINLYLNYSFTRSDISQGFIETPDGDFLTPTALNLAQSPPVDNILTLAQGYFDVKVPSIGCAYNLNDRVVAKVQFVPAEVEESLASLHEEDRFNLFAAALSTFF